MDYTKFLNSNSKFKLSIKSKIINDSINTLKDIKKAEYILLNYERLNYKIELDEYFAYFLKEKNEFIESFQKYIKLIHTNEDMTKDKLTVFKEILSILKSNLDNLITNFKLLKQNIYKKTKQQERFNEQKFIFFSENYDINTNNNNKITNKKLKNAKRPNIELLSKEMEKMEEGTKNKYKESNTVVEMLMDREKQNYEKTKRILYDLSSLNTSFQKKMFEQSEMTKNILFNSLQSIDNIEQGNKHLTQAKQYQKGRGLMIGIIFIILGLFLILYDR